jgi:hypothetical protein
VCAPPLCPHPRPISQAQAVYHFYQTLLGRLPDPPGFDVNLETLRAGGDRPQLFAALQASAEFTGSAALINKGGYLTRVYQTLLQRTPSSAEHAAWVSALQDASGGNGTLGWYAAFQRILESTEYANTARPVAGIHFSIPIVPAVAIPDAVFLAHAYAVVLGRDYDVTGYLHNLEMLRFTTRASFFVDLMGAPEFQGNAALADKAAYVGRVTQALLGRAPTASESAADSLHAFDGSGPGTQTWFQFYEATLASAEYRLHNCHAGYFSYGQALDLGTPLLSDVMTGDVQLRTVADAEVVNLQFAPDGGVTAVWDQKLPMVRDPQSGRTVAFTRGFNQPTNSFNIYMLEELPADAGPPTMVQVGGPLFAKADADTYYDPQVAWDFSTCPARAVMTMECFRPGLPGASLCISYSTTPARAETWTPPVLAVQGCNASEAGCLGRHLSASTGMALVDHKNSYLSWTGVDDGATFQTSADVPDEGTERTSTFGAALPLYQGSVTSVKDHLNGFMLQADPDVYCAAPWDCNNRDAQDWKQEGPWYFAVYNGANYYRCVRPNVDAATHTSQWGLALGYSSQPVGALYERGSQVVMAQRADTCGISYPVVNVVQGKLYLYFAHYDVAGGNSSRRLALTR